MLIADVSLRGFSKEKIKSKPHWQTVNLGKLRLVKDPELNGVGITILIYPFHLYKVYDITMKEIITLAKNPTDRMIFKRIFSFGKKPNINVCKQCSGFGVLDWINKVAKSKNRKPNDEDYKNFKLEVIIEHYQKTTNKLMYYTTMSKLRPGEEHCTACFGSGLQQCNGRDTQFKSTF